MNNILKRQNVAGEAGKKTRRRAIVPCPCSFLNKWFVARSFRDLIVWSVCQDDHFQCR